MPLFNQIKDEISQLVSKKASEQEVSNLEKRMWNGMQNQNHFNNKKKK